VLVLSPRRLIGYSIRDALLARDVPTHSFYHEEALEDNEAQVAFTVLTLLANRQDRVALRFWLGLGSPSWLKGEYARLREYCQTNDVSPWDALEQIDQGTLVMNGVNGLLVRFQDLRARLDELHGLTGLTLVNQVFPDNQPWGKPLREASLLKIQDDTSASKLLDNLRTSITQPEMPESGDFVRVMSLHKSKGLTSRVVIVAGCMEGLIPTLIKGKTLEERSADMKEQRRLFYVAITRGKEILVLSSVTRLPKELAYKIGARVGRYGGTLASRFFGELGGGAPAATIGTDWRANGFV
jgi:superfamily I DNA/RNA helicase